MSPLQKILASTAAQDNIVLYDMNDEAQFDKRPYAALDAKNISNTLCQSAHGI